MQEKKRLFVAIPIEPDQEILKLLTDMKEEWKKEHVKWVKPHNLHLTLKFFGETPVSKIDVIKEALQDAAWRCTPFEMQLKTVGFFGTAKQPKVIWLSADESQTSLKHIHTSIEEELEKAGWKKEERPFKAHLTLGRIRYFHGTVKLKEFSQQYANFSPEKKMISAFSLYQSILNATGPFYKVINNFNFPVS